MCTITYLPFLNKNLQFVVTHNRDESVNRPADVPQIYTEYNTQLFYPKDRRAGGTWIGVSVKNRLISLMNGAFERHQHNPPYRKSRGIVVKELLSLPNILQQIDRYDFKGIEPFFALLFSWADFHTIHEIIWDGKKLYLRNKDVTKPHLWSAAMTYTKAEQMQRRQMFYDLLNNQQRELAADDLWQFHHRRTTTQIEGMIIDRGELKTTSISQFIHVENAEDRFLFENVHSGEKHCRKISWAGIMPD